MFRFLSRQTFKVLPRSRILTSRPIHIMPVPYSGPPSYETIARRFSSEPDPQAFLNRKRQQEAKDRGEFIDIHDIDPKNGLYPVDYDVLLTDIHHQKLKTTISEEIGIPYLSKASETDAKKVVRNSTGYIYGFNNRSIVPLVVGHETEARWVFFILDTGAPWTFLSEKACEALGIDTSAGQVSATLGGHPLQVRVSPSASHFSDVCLLGTDFWEVHKVRLCVDFIERRVKLYIGRQWSWNEPTWNESAP